jgi:hypothetical protein
MFWAFGINMGVCRNLSRRRGQEAGRRRFKSCQRQRVWNQNQNDNIFKEVKVKEEVKNVTEWKTSK